MKNITLILLFLASVNTIWSQNIIVTSQDNNQNAILQEDLIRYTENIININLDHPINIKVSLVDLGHEEIRGIKTRHISKFNIIFKAFDIINNKLLDSHDFTITQTGDTKKETYKNLQLGFIKKKNKFNDWLSSLNNQTLNYDCQDLNNKISSLITENNFSLAYSLTNVNIKGCDKMDKQRKEIFNAYQKKNCEIHIKNAKAYAAIDEFEKSVNELIKVDPHGDCASEIDSIIERLETNKYISKNENFSFFKSYMKDENLSEKFYNLVLLNKLIND